MRRQHAVWGLALIVLTLGFATSCGKKSSSNATTTSTSASMPVAVADVDLGRAIGVDKRVTDKASDFRPNDTIYASVHTTGSSSDAKLKARWTFEDGQVVDETEQAIAPNGDAVTEFHVAKADGWPAGKYKLEVFLNGSSVSTKDFEVK